MRRRGDHNVKVLYDFFRAIRNALPRMVALILGTNHFQFAWSVGDITVYHVMANNGTFL